AVSWRAPRQAQRCRPRPTWRAADDPAVAGRTQALRHQLAVLDLGQPVLPRAAESQLLAHWRDAGRQARWRTPKTGPHTARTARSQESNSVLICDVNAVP